MNDLEVVAEPKQFDDPILSLRKESLDDTILGKDGYEDPFFTPKDES